METRYIDLNGHRTRLIERPGDGSGKEPVLLCLHGFPEHAGGWRPLFRHMEGFRCIAPDQRGYGTSYRPPAVSDYATGKLVRDVIDLIDTLGLERVHLVGHDWGASVAYGTAFGGDPRLASLTILNGVHPVPFQRELARGGAQSEASQYIDWLRNAGSEDVLAANGFERLAAFFAKGMNMDWLTGDVLNEYKAAWQGPETVGAMVNWYRASPIRVAAPGVPLAAEDVPDFPEDRMHVRMPHLLLWGAGDKALLPESRKGLEQFAADLTVKIFADADHWIVHQKPAEIAAEIAAFVARVDA